MKNKIVVVLEGLPGVGKTTLAKRLATEFKGEYIPEIISTDKFKPNQDKYYIESEIAKAKKAAITNKKFCFLDRNHISMLAYNYGKKVNYKENIYEVLVDRFKKLSEPDLYVYLRISDVSVCNQRKGIEGRNPVWVDIKNLEKIKEYYENFFSDKKNKVVVPVDKLSLEEVYKLIVNHLKTNYDE